MADPYTLFWLVIQVFLVIGCMTLVWKINPYFRIIEQVVIGAGTAHMMMYGLQAVQTGAINRIQAGSLTLIIPLILGVVLLGRFTPYKWMARYPIAILIGVGIGIMLAGVMESQVINLMRSLGENVIANPFGSLNWTSNVLAGIGAVFALTYFIYTREHKGVLGMSARIGRLVLMAGFGIAWGGENGWFITAFATYVESIVKLIKALFGMPI